MPKKIFGKVFALKNYIFRALGSTQSLHSLDIRSKNKFGHRDFSNWEITTQKLTLRDRLSNALYKAHLKLRYPHDIAWDKIPWYRRFASNDRNGIKRGTLTAFVI
jgi:hypothetical protein